MRIFLQYNSMTETEVDLDLILTAITDGIVVVDECGIVLYAIKVPNIFLSAEPCRAVIWPCRFLQLRPIKTSI